jgi:hypothetical protein
VATAEMTSVRRSRCIPFLKTPAFTSSNRKFAP